MSIIGFVLGGFKVVWGFLAKLEPFQLLSLGLGIWLLLALAQRNDARHDADAWHNQFKSERQARLADRKSFADAQAEAKRRNIEQVQKIEAQHEQITDRVRSDYQRDLERLRVASKANPSSPSGTKVPNVPPTAGGTDAENVPLPAERILPLARELELQCNALKDWVTEQLKVD